LTLYVTVCDISNHFYERFKACKSKELENAASNNVSAESLKLRPMVRQMWESVLRQTMHVRVASDTQTILLGPKDVVRYGVT